MKFESVLFKSVLAAAALTGASAVAANAPAPNPRQAIDQAIEAQKKVSRKYRDIAAMLEKCLQDEDVRTNAMLRVYVDQKILGCCVMPGWTQFINWDKQWADATLPGVCEREIAAVDCPNGDKIKFLHALARHQAGLKDYATALETARKALELPNLNKYDLFKAHSLVADAYRWSDDYEQAKAELQEAAKSNAYDGAKALANLASDYGKDADIDAAWADYKDPSARLGWYYNNNRAKVADEVFAYVSDTNNPVKTRRELLIRYFGAEKSERGDRAREIAKTLDYTGFVDFALYNEFGKIYRFGDWKFYTQVFETFRSWSYFQDQGRVRAYLFSLVATGRANEVAAFANDFLAQDAAKAKPALKPFDAVCFRLLKALAEGKDLVEAVKAENLDAKDRARALQIAAQWCLNLQRNEECERTAAAYKALFKEIPERRYDVTYFDKPVTSIASWRGIYDQLEKSYVDIKMCGALDSLETDVATGRAEIQKTELDSKDARMEVTSFCDVNGLKIVLRVADPNARAVEQGFAGGMGTESYFAPGAGEPYVCFSSSPKEGIGFVFYTAYSSAYSQRVEYGDDQNPYALRQETEFTDDDYVLMLSLPWRAFYQKLPAAAGTEWRFETMADGYSWGGSQGVHEASSWGRLVFNLKPEEIAAIRRRLVYDTYRSWKVSGHEHLSSFDRWGDPVVGDQEFYNAMLKPLQAELEAQAAKVTLKMTDDEVNEVYEKGAKIWIGLDHHIDGLRQSYLLKKFIGR